MFLAPRALHSSSLRPILVTFLAAMIVLHAWMFFSLRREIVTGYPDFTIFYTAGKCLIQGRGRQLYDLETQFAIQREFASEVKHRENPLPFNHPPFEAFLFAPLARLPYAAAYLVWAVFNLALILGFWKLLRPRLPSLHGFLPALPLLAMFAFFPLIMALLQGQDSILLLFLYGLAFCACATGRPFVAGLCLGLALFKFQLVLPFVLVLLVRRQWRAVAGFLITAFVLLSVSAAVVGWSGVMAYPGFVLRLSRSGAQAGIYPRDMPDLRGLVAGSLHLAGLPATLLISALSFALVALAARWWHVQPGRQFVLGFSLCLTVTIIASYHLLVHDLSVLMLPILLVAELIVAGQILGPARRILVASLTALFLTPVYAVLQFWLREMNLMVTAVAMFAAGTAIALTSKRGSASVEKPAAQRAM
ncbi:MAG: glycosyltransferase family 87 protein [Terriglobales bacterium]